MTPPGAPSDRWWKALWIMSIAALLWISAPTFRDIYVLHSARKEGDLPRALAAAHALSDGFFGPVLSPWLDELTNDIRKEVVEGNLLSIKRLVPDSE